MLGLPEYSIDGLSDEWFDGLARGDAARFEHELRREIAPGHELSDED